MPKHGHGQFRKIANFLGINSVNVTQIFRGSRELTVEHAVLLCEYFGLSEIEGHYFVGLVELARAGHFKLKQMIQKRLDEILEKSQNLKTRLSSHETLSDANKALFYSSWYNSAIRLGTSIKDLQNADAIAKRFNLPLLTVNRVIEFLLQTGLCKLEQGRLRMGPSSTHLEASSPLIARHHTNWRMKAIEKFDTLTSDELCLSMPCSLSQTSAQEIRRELVTFIEHVTEIIDRGPEEQLRCLNIDWFKI